MDERTQHWDSETGMAGTSGGNILILGLGKTGLSCARYLKGQGLQVAITDSRDHPPGLGAVRAEMPDLALFLGGFAPEVFAAAQQLVLSPGVPLREPLVQTALQRGVPVIGDIELFARAVRAPVAAVTGSNGKSTVATLLGEMAGYAGWKTGVGGNLGDPALDLLDDTNRFYVLELSSFQLETTHSLRAKAAAVLNVSPDHLDRYPDLDAYAAAKSVVYRGAEVGIVNRDDPRVMGMRGLAGKELGFTLGEPQGEDYGLREQGGQIWLSRGSQRLLPASRLAVSGRHNLANALAALALGEASGLPTTAMLEGMTHFRGLAHRTQLVAEHAGVRWYNDSKATNVGATIAALEGLHPASGDTRTLLIAGGEGKDADFAPLAAAVALTARAVILMGRDAALIARALAGSGIPLLQAADMDEAVALAADKVQPGDRVLLSPACASFDMFRDFTARGEAFTAAVGRLFT